MGTDEMKLVDMEKAATAIDTRFIIQKEWAMDPPPFMIKRLPDHVVIDMHRAKLSHLAKVSNLMSQVHQVEMEMFNEVAEIMQKG